MKIALYSCNFGNYRDEFSNFYNTIFDKNIDYFLFTDKKITDEEEIENLKNWNICNIDILPSDEIMDGCRWTSKYVKFILPENLRKYDIIIWSDSKNFKKNIFSQITYEKIIERLNNYPNYDVFNWKHPERNTAQEELLETIHYNLENKEPGEYFLNFIKDHVSKFNLPDTCIIIRKNNLIINEVFEYCFELFKKFKLKRDQNIYNFAFDTKKITPILFNLNFEFFDDKN